jgi:hypothetical protein
LAPRLRTTERRLHLQPRLVTAGLVALALLGLGEAAPGAFPVPVSIEAHGAALQVTVDGQTHSLSSPLGGGWRGVSLEQPGPLEREYQIDGSDTTSTDDRSLRLIGSLTGSPLYRLDAWLRDESSYSRWEGFSLVDLGSGQTTAAVTGTSPLPTDFRLTVNLRRPEAPARVWLLGATPDRREGLELDRDRRNARWLIERNGGRDALPRWFFPEQPAPFAAELLNLLGRAAAAGYALTIVTLGVGWLLARKHALSRVARLPEWSARLAIDVILAGWLVAAALVSTRLYHQLPHILDAVSYTFQASLFASGQLTLPAPAITDAFKGPFEVLSQGQIFSQYPPGTPAIYALGEVVHLEWLVGPLAGVLLIASTAFTARTLFGSACALAVLGLGALSPFILFQAGSYLSHPVVGGLLAGALAAFVAAECGRGPRWYAVSAALLGAGFLGREVASVLFALPLGARLLQQRRWDALLRMVSFGLPFVLLYLLYNASVTGSPWLLPRTLFDPSDHFGFGEGIGFHTRHTLAAGLANTDELLTLLQFDLFGWPPLFAFGLVGLPFLLGRARGWDVVAAGGFLAFVAAYVGYFYHGIALGPRYYFEAVPWLLLLAARGLQLLAELSRSRVAATLVVGLLSLNSVLFYLPSEVQRRADFSGLPGGAKLSLGFVRPSLFGPELDAVPRPALVLTSDWWIYNAGLAALNCSHLPDCDVLFAYATSQRDIDRLRDQYSGRTVLLAVANNGRVELLPYTAGDG